MSYTKFAVIAPLLATLAVGCAKDANQSEAETFGPSYTSPSTASVTCTAAPRVSGAKHWAKPGHSFRYNGAPDLGALGRNIQSARIQFQLQSELVQNNMIIYGGITQAPAATQSGLAPLQVSVSTGSSYTVNFDVQRTQVGNYYASKIHIDANLGGGQMSRSTYDCPAPALEVSQNPAHQIRPWGSEPSTTQSPAPSNCSPVSLPVTIDTLVAAFPRGTTGYVSYRIFRASDDRETSSKVDRYVSSTGYVGSASVSTTFGGSHRIVAEYKPSNGGSILRGEQIVSFGSGSCAQTPNLPNVRIQVR